MTLTDKAATDLAHKLIREGRLSEGALRKMRVPQRDLLPTIAAAEARHVNEVHTAWPARLDEYRGEWR